MSDAFFELQPEEKQLLENLPAAIAVYQYTEGKIVPVFLTGKFIKIFGYQSEAQAIEAKGRDLYRDAHPDDVARLSDRFWHFVKKESPYDVIYRNRNWRQTGYHIIHATGSHVFRGETHLLFVTYVDASNVLDGKNRGDSEMIDAFGENISSENAIHRNQFDDLTGLPTIGRFFENTPAIIRDMQSRKEQAAVLWLNFRGLKEYDELHGFSTGDDLIRGFAGLLRERFGWERSARFDGDRFVVCTEMAGLTAKIEALFGDVAKLNNQNSLPLCIGIYPLSSEDVGLPIACDRAKLACDSLNDKPRSAYAFLDQQMLEDAALKKYVVQHFRKAMKEGWIHAYYQPVVRTVTGMLCGAEALCRWIDPVHGFISPGKFIPALEEQDLIFQLDLYMVEQVCLDYQRNIKAGRGVVPVSINLSRKDFRHQDLVSRIEALAKKYQVPREIMNIEITESAFIRHQERLSHFIGLFHELGFQVWMDDFGTAYSSLGSLKDLSFDELKIDMSFLSSSTERARRIVTSVVRMAKEIGVQTLAEGVETEEQYEFLRRIGCEKIQGFYFGKPMDGPALDRHCLEHHLEKEPLRLRHYYDALSRIDYQTDQPLCVIEDDGTTMRPLFMNEAYQAVLHRDGTDRIDFWADEVNSDNNPIHSLYRQYANEQLRKREGSQTLTYPSGDHYLELKGKVAAHYENQYIYVLNIRFIQLNPEENQKDADFLRNLYYICHDIAVIDLDRWIMYGLKSSSSAQPIGSGGKEIDLSLAVSAWEKDFVYFMDQERLERFFDLNTLRERILKNQGQSLNGFFRSRSKNGEYHWLLHMLMPIPKTSGGQILAVTICPGTDLPMLQETEDVSAEQMPENQLMPVKDQKEMAFLLWKNLERFSEEKYFWKNRDRQFVGANQKFLDFYGFNSLDEILGKTDEDMHWHVQTEPFKQDELDVLEKGACVNHALGTCIAHGKQHTILASKVPVYRNGKIVGLLGKFADADDLMRTLNQRHHSESVDAVTGLSNAKGILESFHSYLEELWEKGTCFVIMKIYNEEFEPFRENYGEDAARKMLRHCGGLLRGIAGKECVIGRATEDYFFILKQYQSRDEADSLAEQIKKEVGKMQRVDDLQCACTLKIDVSYLTLENAPQDRYVNLVFQVMSGVMGSHD